MKKSFRIILITFIVIISVYASYSIAQTSSMETNCEHYSTPNCIYRWDYYTDCCRPIYDTIAPDGSECQVWCW